MSKKKRYNEHTGFPATTDETPAPYEAVAAIEDAPIVEPTKDDTTRFYLIGTAYFIDVPTANAHLIPTSKFTTQNPY